jgi:hypothetical protein
MDRCLNCNRTEEQVPLLVLQFRGEATHICPQCLPLLIHKPEKLADKLPGMEIVKPAEH